MKKTKVSQYLQANFAQPVLNGAEKVQKLVKGGKKEDGKQMSKHTCKFMQKPVRAETGNKLLFPFNRSA